MKKIGISILLATLASAIYVVTLRSSPLLKTEYGIDIYITFYEKHYEILSCERKTENCTNKINLREKEKEKNPNEYQTDYSKEILNELEKYIVKEKDIQIHFTDYVTNDISNKRMQEIRDWSKTKDANIFVSAMVRHI